MPKADGTVVIDTKINSNGIEVGTKEIEAAAKRMASSVDNIGEKAKISLQKQTYNSESYINSRIDLGIVFFIKYRTI